MKIFDALTGASRENIRTYLAQTALQAKQAAAKTLTNQQQGNFKTMNEQILTEQDRQVAILKRFLNTPASERPIKPDESDRLSNAYGEALIYLSEVLSAEPGNEDKSISDIRMGLRDTHPMLFKAGFSGDLAAAGAAAAEWEVLHCNVKGGGMKAAAKLAATRAPAAIKAMFERKGAK